MPPGELLTPLDVPGRKPPSSSVLVSFQQSCDSQCPFIRSCTCLPGLTQHTLPGFHGQPRTSCCHSGCWLGHCSLSRTIYHCFFFVFSPSLYLSFALSLLSPFLSISCHHPLPSFFLFPACLQSPVFPSPSLIPCLLPPLPQHTKWRTSGSWCPSGWDSVCLGIGLVGSLCRHDCLGHRHPK